MEESYNSKALELINQADRIWRSYFKSKDQKNDETIDLYKQAATYYKLDKNFQDAAKTYLQIIINLEKLKDKDLYEIANNYIEAAKCYKKCDENMKAIECYTNTVSLFEELGKIREASKILVEIAEIYGLLNKIDNSIEFYKKAYKYIEIESSSDSAINKIILKLAEIYTNKKDYVEVIKYYDIIIKKSIDSNLLKYDVRNYIFDSILCSLILDYQKAHNNLDLYKNLDSSFENTREYKFLKDLLKYYLNNDLDNIINLIYKYDNITKLNAYKINLLLIIKNNIENGNNNL